MQFHDYDIDIIAHLTRKCNKTFILLRSLPTKAFAAGFTANYPMQFPALQLVAATKYQLLLRLCYVLLRALLTVLTHDILIPGPFEVARDRCY